MLKIIIFLGFIAFFFMFWYWILSSEHDYTPPPGRI